MTDYYADRLAGTRLLRVYELAPPRVSQYLESEIRYVLGLIRPGDAVLELGCGYGRVTERLAERADSVVGIDVAEGSLALARERGGPTSRCEFLLMDACDMSFPDGGFDVVVCVQNGICAFGEPADVLVAEALRVTRPGGRAVFSSYSEAFWPDRLWWFELQAEAGLLGPIDREETGDGVIVCEDGFRAGAMGRGEFERLCAQVGVTGEIAEVDGSSLFCVLVKPEGA